MGTLTTITEPTIEPVTVEEAKLALNIEHDDDDIRIEGYIQAAREWAEKYLDKRIMTQTVERSYDTWPASIIDLDVDPIQSIDSIKYDDTSSPVTEITYTENTDYYTDIKTDGGRVVSINGWDSVADKPNAIRIRMTVGYTTQALVPFQIKEGIKAFVVYLYEQNCDMMQVAKDILWAVKRL